MLKGLARRALRSVTLKRKLPNGVPIYVTPDSQLKYLRRRFDVDLIDLCDRYVDQNSRVWDVGANCGVMAFSSARARQIVAVEADPYLAHLLQRSAAANGVPVAIVVAAAYSSIGLSSFSIAKNGRASNHLTSAGGRSQTGGERSRIHVPTLRLDDLLDHFEPPTLIKIDVEGAEIDVLTGCEHILEEHKPIIYFEAGGESFPCCKKILESSGYALTHGGEMNWLARPTQAEGALFT